MFHHIRNTRAEVFAVKLVVVCLEIGQMGAVRKQKSSQKVNGKVICYTLTVAFLMPFCIKSHI